MIRRMLWPCVFFFLFCSCERPTFVKEVDPPVLISKSYAVQEFVRNYADIIWVIDNSGSMQEFQNAVIQNMDTFMDAFVQTARGANWRMGLISTDKTEMPYIGFTFYDYLDNNSIEPVERFNQAVRRLGTSGSSDEESFLPIERAITLYPNFLRENAKLFIIIVSDEREGGDETVDDFLDFVYSLKAPEDVAAYGVFEMPERGCGQEKFIDSRYAEFIHKTNGLVFPICSPNYGKGLSEFGSDIAKRTSYSRIRLPNAPVAETIEVIYQGKKIPIGTTEEGGYWKYNPVDNYIYFHNLDFLVGFDLETVRVNFEKARRLEE